MSETFAGMMNSDCESGPHPDKNEAAPWSHSPNLLTSPTYTLPLHTPSPSDLGYEQYLRLTLKFFLVQYQVRSGHIEHCQPGTISRTETLWHRDLSSPLP